MPISGNVASHSDGFPDVLMLEIIALRVKETEPGAQRPVPRMLFLSWFS